MNSGNNNSTLLRYAGLTVQILVSLGVGVFVGIKLDKWLKFNQPVLVWVLPLFIIIGLLILVIRDTSRKKNESIKK